MSEEIQFTDDIAVVDRSTLERYGDCPAQARFVADGRVITSSHLTDVGSAVHDALGYVIGDYVNSRGNLSVTELQDTAMQMLCASRPDVQQDAIKAMRPSLWSWAAYIHELHPDNILRWDGGEGDHSGQLAWDISGVRVTSEVDLIHTGRAKEVVTEVDYKSGWKRHLAGDVERSFQFCTHAWLIFENYPAVQEVQIRVWNSRRKALTLPVIWERRDIYQLSYRVNSAVQNWLRYRDLPAEKCPTWPNAEKCGFCPAAALCPAVPHDIREYVANPGLLVDQMLAVGSRLDALQRIAGGIVDQTGRDIVTESGLAFGVEKPKAERKPTKAIYFILKGDDDGGAEASGGNDGG